MTISTPRIDGRLANQTRKITITPNVNDYAEGSCAVHCGKTHLLITATVEDGVPTFLKKSGRGWVTAEYGMLPRSTDKRLDRARTIDDGRVKEIQRLIGRSLRAIVDFHKLGERQIKLDCDVLFADGGTRTAAINGAFVALQLACNHLLKNGVISENPIKHGLVAISAGVVKGECMLDLCYEEDSKAELDGNFVMADNGNLIEIQMTAEMGNFDNKTMNKLVKMAQSSVGKISKIQQKSLQ